MTGEEVKPDRKMKYPGFIHIQFQPAFRQKIGQQIQRGDPIRQTPHGYDQVIGVADQIPIFVINLSVWVKVLIEVSLKSIQRHVAQDWGERGPHGNALFGGKQFPGKHSSRPQKLPQHLGVHRNML